MATDLSTMKLSELESIVERGLASFIEVGNALIEIRDAKMYGSEYETFEDYCNHRFDMSRSRAYQLIEATKTVAHLSTIVDTASLPVAESQVRALQNATSDPKEQAKILKKAAKDAPKDKDGKPKITAAEIKKAAGIDPEADRKAAILGAQRTTEREPGDETEVEDATERFKTQRSKTIKTAEALLRAFDDLQELKSRKGIHANAIETVKKLIATAKEW